MKRNVGLLLAGALIAAIFVTTATAQVRVVTYNIAKLNGDNNALIEVLQTASNDDSHGFATPVSVYLFQEVIGFSIPTLHAIVGPEYSLGTFTDQGDSGSGGAQAMFYLATQFIEDTPSHIDIYSQAGRHADRWRLDLLGYDNVSIYFYSMHLKASTGSTNQEKRRLGAEAIRDDIMTLTAGSHVIAAGDMNFYSQNEPAYQWFTDVGAGQVIDPLGIGVPWGGQANAIKHSQSPLASQNGALIGGGLDDRFDFQFISTTLDDSQGIAIISGTYRSLGNDGQHYNTDINAGDSNYFAGDVVRSNALADALFIASDHIPVIADFQVPAMFGWSIVPIPSRVLVDASASVEVVLQNNADVVAPEGADTLDVNVEALGDVTGVQSTSVSALSPPSVIPFPLDTALAGGWNAALTITVTSQDVNTPPVITKLAGEIINHANPSFSSVQDLDAYTHDVSFEVGTGVQTFDVMFFHYGYDGSQSMLEIDNVSSLTLPIVFLGQSANTVGATPVLLTFEIDTDSIPSGLYSSTVTITTSDEDLLGEQVYDSLLTVRVEVTDPLTCIADINGDGQVAVEDILVLIGDWGLSSSPADLTGANGMPDGTVDIADLLMMIGAWGPC